MQRADDEARELRRTPAGGGEHTEHERARQQEQRDNAGAPRRVPQRLPVAGGGKQRHAGSAGQPATRLTAPSYRISRAGRRSSSNHASAGSPSTIAAVLAVFASTQDAAATVALRQKLAAGRPVRGSTTWCSSPSLLAQRRTVVPE